MPERPHEGAEGVARGGLAVGRHPEDLAAERVGILRHVLPAGVADGRVQVPVGADREASAVVPAAARQPVEDDLGLIDQDAMLEAAEAADRGKA